MIENLADKNLSFQSTQSAHLKKLTAIEAQLFDSIGTNEILRHFVRSTGDFMNSKFTNFSIHAPNSELERVVTYPDATPAQLTCIPKINQYIEQQPVLPYLRSHKDKLVVTKISDFLSIEAFRKTDLYQKGYGPMGFDFMLSAGIWDNQNRLYAFNVTHPERDFDEQQRSDLEQLFLAFIRAFQLNNFVRIRVEEIHDVTSLTKSQKKILIWVGEGKTNQEISTITGLSPKTVEKHIRNICRTLGFKKRMELIDYCVKQTRVHFPALDQKNSDSRLHDSPEVPIHH